MKAGSRVLQLGVIVICISLMAVGCSTSSSATKGAGLGLYLARAVIEAHGGRIWVDPKPGEGARICFSLPL